MNKTEWLNNNRCSIWGWREQRGVPAVGEIDTQWGGGPWLGREDRGYSTQALLVFTLLGEVKGKEGSQGNWRSYLPCVWDTV